MGYGVWGVSPFLLHTIAGIPKSYGFSGVMGLEEYGLGGVLLETRLGLRLPVPVAVFI